MDSPLAAALLAPLLAAPVPHEGGDALAGVALQVRSKSATASAAIHEAGRAAAARLADPACARVLTEFRDSAGRTLQERLDATGRTAAGQLQSVYFYDGAHRAGCQRARTLAVTEPGSFVVHVCPQFVRSQRQDPGNAAVVLIHELLHTLGLGENPPASETITRHVRSRCGP